MPLATGRPSSSSQPTSVSRPSNVPRPSSTGLRSSTIGRPSSATRSSSATRASNSRRINQDTRDTFGRPSTGLRRYGSDSYLNTPSRFTLSTPKGRSPAVRQSVAPPDSSRKSKHENVLKVQEILQRDEAFYADLNLKNDCLKSMTTNQFYSIINRFARLISGKDLDAFMQSGDPLQGILNFMSQLQYPYTINRSMLKTPNAPHTFDHIVVMLLWLGNAGNIPFLASDDSFIDKFLYNQDQHFPTEEYTAMFSKAVQNGYLLWNNESDEHSEFLDQLTDGMVSAKLNHKVSSVAELEASTEKLRIKSRELAENPVQLNNVHHYEQLESKYIEYETKEHDLVNKLKEKRDRLAAIKVNWNDKRNKVEKSLGQMNELADQIHNQRFSIDEYKKLSQDMALIKAAADTIRAEVKMIRDEESNQHINRARLLKKVSEAIAAINDRGMRIVKIINNTRLKVSEQDLNKLHLPSSPTIEQVQALDRMLSHILSVVKVQKHKAQIELDKANGKLNVLKAESASLTKEFQCTQKKFKEATFEREVVEKKSVMKSKKHENCTLKLVKQADDAKIKIEDLKQNIAAAHEKRKQLEKEISKLMDDAETQSMVIIQEKQRALQKIDAIEKSLNEPLDALGYPK